MSSIFSSMYGGGLRWDSHSLQSMSCIQDTCDMFQIAIGFTVIYGKNSLHNVFFSTLRFPVILSIENHCSIQQQKKIAQYLREIFGDKLDVGDVLSRESKTLPSPHSLQGKILIKVRASL